MDIRYLGFTPEDLKPVTKEELMEMPIEELLIIAKYMRIKYNKELSKDDLAELIIVRERARAPYPNEDGLRFSFEPNSPHEKKHKIKKALSNIEEVLLSLIK